MEHKSKQELIEFSHKFRDNLLNAVERGDKAFVKEHAKKSLLLAEHDELGLFKRTPKNRMRSHKNFLLSYNTAYSIAAEKGGLPAIKSHYIAEKYAILIEHADNLKQIDQLHHEMLKEYVDLDNRFKIDKGKTSVEKVANYIEYNFSEDFSIEELAEFSHMHPSHLMRTFKKEYGITIGGYQRKIRIEEAKKLLSESNLSVTEVAFMVGFNDSQYFSRIFKKEVLVSPKQFKLQSKK